MRGHQWRQSVIVAAACLFMIGCAADPYSGYSSADVWSGGVDSIAVTMFGNETSVNGLEVKLTEAIRKEIISRTGWSIVPVDSAQTLLKGTIIGVDLRKLSTTRGTGLAEEIAVRLKVDFEWVDRRTGQPITRRMGFSVAGSFVPARPARERLEMGEHAAISELARDIVSELRSNW